MSMNDASHQAATQRYLDWYNANKIPVDNKQSNN